ncbi:MAG: tRNA (cytidine(34)-2'-O)-methyltransferase [Pseudomonadota bacterium]|nr:tRNA (cytidine(34)-2'-O)-methyltransferase [Pseudomonadota bacterium]
MRLALFQPDIPQNLGGAIRLTACLGVPLEVIEPCAFPLSDRALRRAAMDYGDVAQVTRHAGWEDFRTETRKSGARIVLFTTRGAEPFHRFAFREDDVLLFGRESAGVPDDVHDAADARLVIPIQRGMRSLNLAVSAAIGLAEGLRQTESFPV